MIRVFERSTVIQELLEDFEVLGTMQYKKEVAERTFFYTFSKRSFSVDNTIFTSIVFSQNGTFIDIYFYTESDNIELQNALVKMFDYNEVKYELIKE